MSKSNATEEQQPLPPTSSSISQNASQADLDFYTWTNLFRLLAGQGTPDERKQYINARDVIKEKSDCARCEKHRDWIFQNSPIVTFLRQQIQTLSPNLDINASNTRCRRCVTPQQGGFHSDYGILLCANNLPTRSKTEDALAHEMIHAYDHARFRVDRGNMAHQACTEIRASMLSGECRFTREFFGRSQWKIASQMQECVRRRAVTSLLGRPAIAGDVKKAEKEVDGVWESCFRDTRPFDEIFR